jgi:catechol 2,3-dioxygenase-like lactoylglutathione lyase family enzyme
MANTPFLGLRTVVYFVSDLEQAKTWYARMLGIAPYFDEAFYVGFRVGGFELGLDPDPAAGTPGAGGATADWGVRDAGEALARLRSLGAEADGEVQEVGGGIRVATVRDPFGNRFGLIENPNFRMEPA